MKRTADEMIEVDKIKRWARCVSLNQAAQVANVHIR